MKKYSNHTKLFLLLAVLLQGTACKKLTEEPKSFVDPAQFYTTPGQVESAYAAAMDKLWDAWAAYSGDNGTSLFVNDDQLFSGDLVISDNWADGIWSAHYAALLNINAALNGIKKGNLTGTDTATTAQLAAEGRFLRAYNYFMLVRMFGDVPLITEDTPDPVSNPLGRSPIADVYKQIESDFLYAIAELPPTPSSPGKPSGGAAKGLLAKVYLTMATAPTNDASNYAKAATLAGELIQSHTYSLIQDVNNVFNPDHKYDPEMMFSYNSNVVDPATDPHSWMPNFLDGWGGGEVEPTFAAKFPDSQPRKKAYLFYEYNGVPYTDPLWGQDNNCPSIQKFLYQTPDQFNAGISTLNLPIIRYADVLLIYAEASNMANGGPSQDAVNAVNQVIDRANGWVANPDYPDLTTGMGQGDFDAAVIKERSMELCFEMDRWFDLVRKRMLKDVNPDYQQNFTDDDYLFPIPQLDLALNKKLTQNPGYPLPPSRQ